MSQKRTQAINPAGTVDKEGWFNHGQGVTSRFMPEARIDGRMTEVEHIRLSRGEMSNAEYAKICARPAPETGARPTSGAGARNVAETLPRMLPLNVARKVQPKKKTPKAKKNS